MVASRYTWFQKFISSIWIFGAMFLYLGVSTANMMSLRDVDASLGILSRPANSFLAKAGNAIFGAPKVNAIPAEITIDVPRVAEQLLNAGIRIAISTLISEITQFVTNLLIGLLDDIETLVKSLTGLKLNLSSAKSFIALKAFEYERKINKCMDPWLDKYLPTVDESTLTDEQRGERDAARAEVKSILDMKCLQASLDGVKDPATTTSSATDQGIYSNIDVDEISSLLTKRVYDQCAEDRRNAGFELIVGSINPCEEEVARMLDDSKSQLQSDIARVQAGAKKASDDTVESKNNVCGLSIDFNAETTGGSVTYDTTLDATTTITASYDTDDTLGNVTSVTAPLEVQYVDKAACDAAASKAALAAATINEANKKDALNLNADELIASGLKDLIKGVVDTVVKSLKKSLTSFISDAFKRISQGLPNVWKSTFNNFRDVFNQAVNDVKVGVNFCKKSSISSSKSSSSSVKC